MWGNIVHAALCLSIVNLCCKSLISCTRAGLYACTTRCLRDQCLARFSVYAVLVILHRAWQSNLLNAACCPTCVPLVIILSVVEMCCSQVGLSVAAAVAACIQRTQHGDAGSQFAAHCLPVPPDVLADGKALRRIEQCIAEQQYKPFEAQHI